MRNDDNAAYLRYTGPLRVDKAMHSLEGILRGITIDGRVNSRELSALTGWISKHQTYSDRHPFDEVISRLHEILSDGIVDEEEQADILWLCDKFSTENRYFSQVSADMQRLQGILGGIAADGRITKEELLPLQDWMETNAHLRTCWPYDELDSLIVSVLQDGVIDSDEHDALLKFFKEFTDLSDEQVVSLKEDSDSPLVSGVCAACPQITIDSKVFCFTGSSEKMTRKQLAQQIEDYGGIFSPRVTKSTDYLIIGAAGNPCWSYACYGRKVEHAIKLRKEGAGLLLVHEHDYWDCIEDLL